MCSEKDEKVMQKMRALATCGLTLISNSSNIKTCRQDSTQLRAQLVQRRFARLRARALRRVQCPRRLQHCCGVFRGEALLHRTEPPRSH